MRSMSFCGSGGRQCALFQSWRNSRTTIGINAMMEEVAAQARSGSVALPFINPVDHETAPFGGLNCWRLCFGVPCAAELVQQPCRWRRKLVRAVDRPGVAPAARVDARRRQHIAAVAAHIDALSDLAGRVADRRLWRLEIDMPATRRDDLDGGRQFIMRTFELAQLGFGIKPVYVDDEYAGDRASGDRDIEAGIVKPPLADRVKIGCGILAAVRSCRPFVERPARKNGAPPLSQRERCADHSHSLSD